MKSKGQAGRREGGKVAERRGKTGEEGRQEGCEGLSLLDAQSVSIWSWKPRGHIHVLVPL